MLDARAPMLQALHTVLRTQVDATSPDRAQADAQARTSTADAAHVPHLGAPVLAVAAKGGLVQCAGQDWLMANGEGAALVAGQDWSLSSGGAWRVHTGQGIGVLAGAVKPGTAPGAAGTGLTMVAAQGPVSLRAHAGPAQVAAQGAVQLHSARQHLDVRAATTLTLATAGGASLTLSANGITVQCPGQITVKAATKSFLGPGSVPQQMPVLPQSVVTTQRQHPFSV